MRRLKEGKKLRIFLTIFYLLCFAGRCVCGREKKVTAKSCRLLGWLVLLNRRWKRRASDACMRVGGEDFALRLLLIRLVLSALGPPSPNELHLSFPRSALPLNERNFKREDDPVGWKINLRKLFYLSQHSRLGFLTLSTQIGGWTHQGAVISRHPKRSGGGGDTKEKNKNKRFEPFECVSGHDKGKSKESERKSSSRKK